MTIFKILSWDDVRHRPFKKMTGQPRGRSPARRVPSTAPGGPEEAAETKPVQDGSPSSTLMILFKVLEALFIYVTSERTNPDLPELHSRADLIFRVITACNSGLDDRQVEAQRKFARALTDTKNEREKILRDLKDLDRVEKTPMLFFTLLVAGTLSLAYMALL